MNRPSFGSIAARTPTAFSYSASERALKNNRGIAAITDAIPAPVIPTNKLSGLRDNGKFCISMPDQRHFFNHDQL